MLSLPLFGQYGWNATVTLADNTTWCATGNCLTSIGGVTVETKAGVDGTIYGLNSAGAVFTYTHAAGWVEAASALQKAGGLAIEHISVGSAANVLAQTTGSNNVYILNSAKTAWTLLAGGGTCADAEIGADGDIWCLASGDIFHWVSGAWVNIAGSATSLSVGDAHNVWVANSAGSLFTFNASGEWSVVSPGFAVSAAINAIAAAGETAIAAIDTSGGIHVSANAGASWSTILGTASSIAGGGPMTFVRSSSGVSYHLNLTVPSLSVPGYGTWPCPPSACEQGGNCAPGCVGENTVSATAKFGGVGGAHGTAGVTAQQTAPPATYINIQATEEATFCDVFYIEDGYSQECEAIGNGTALDGVGGRLGSFAPILPIPQFELATTLGKWTGEYGNCTKGSQGLTYCDFQVINYCTVATPPPDFNVNGFFIHDLLFVPPATAWYMEGACVRFSGPWACLLLPTAVEASFSPNVIPGTCTFNP
ncbi:MAG TPA: tectonin domain-containing protein [Candidatus Dormibacteraeota bacterium]|nr:tectonin domain-containing protein [Candidatus Dormibacteraeota bacterium]